MSPKFAPPAISSLPRETQLLLQRITDHKLHHTLSLLNESLDPLQYRASVLIPLSVDPKTSKLHVHLTQRSHKLRSHAGEVSFPGGKKDDLDGDDVETALREAMEEINLLQSQVAILGSLEVTVSRGLLLVTPIVGLIDDNFEPEMNEHEVAAVFKVELESFLSASDHEHEDVSWLGSMWRMHRFHRNGFRITGMTAALLVKLAEVVYGKKSDMGAQAEGQDEVEIILGLVKDGRFKWKDGIAVSAQEELLKL